MELIVNRDVRPSAAPPVSSEAAGDSDIRIETRVTAADRPLLITTAVLVLLGLVSVFSASAHEAQAESGNGFSILLKQLIHAVIGFALMIGVSRTNFQVWRRLAKPIALLTLGLLIATLFVGKTANGGERWIVLPLGVQFQPSDIAKLSAVILMAQVISRKKLFSLTFCVNLALVGLMTLLIYQQPSLSVALIIGAMTLMMLFVGGLPFTILMTAVPTVGYLLYEKIMTVEYQRRRIEGWLNPWADAQDTGYNLIQSYYAIGSGGLFGTGFGHSVQKLYYLPFPYTDFIFSVICEEWGLFGALIVVGLFVLFAWRGFAIAMSCPSPFGQMLAFGLTLIILLQAILNLAVTIGLMPVTGVTLPFISYGGTSMILTLLMVGILLSVSRYKITSRIGEPAIG